MGRKQLADSGILKESKGLQTAGKAVEGEVMDMTMFSGLFSSSSSSGDKESVLNQDDLIVQVIFTSVCYRVRSKVFLPLTSTPTTYPGPTQGQRDKKPPESLGGSGTTRSSVSMLLVIRRVSVLEAAERIHGLERAHAQSCLAMMAAPGGLFLDVKSNFSTPQQLKWFASTLQGIGINVKVCGARGRAKEA